MRSSLLLLLAAVLAGCGLTPVPAPEPLPAMPMPTPVPAPSELLLPARSEPAVEVTVYAELTDDGTATVSTELVYALGDEYPSHVEVRTPGGLVAEKTCSISGLGQVSWKRVAQVEGTAASVVLGRATVQIELRGEGTVTAVVEGELSGVTCWLADGGTGSTTWPLRHTFTIHVHRPAGFVLEQLHQRWPGCREHVVVPAGPGLWLPRARAVNAAGAAFTAANAPEPVALTLRSSGSLEHSEGAGELSARAGVVSVTAATALPVTGVTSFEVIAPAALTRVDASLFLQLAALKGPITQPLEDGATYARILPDEENFAGVKVESAATSSGAVCAPLPSEWFTATSATPAQCASGTNAVSILTPGECWFEVSLPGTIFSWSAGFTISK